jgi:hypothetical protein
MLELSRPPVFYLDLPKIIAGLTLDIAGTAWNEGANKGGTGRPVSLLTHFILENAKSL